MSFSQLQVGFCRTVDLLNAAPLEEYIRLTLFKANSKKSIGQLQGENKGKCVSGKY